MGELPDAAWKLLVVDTLSSGSPLCLVRVPVKPAGITSPFLYFWAMLP